MAVATWGGRDFSIHENRGDDGSINARIDMPSQQANVADRASGLTVTLKPAFAVALKDALRDTSVNVYDHLGCGTLGKNISVRCLRPTEEEEARLQDLGCSELVTPFVVSDNEVLIGPTTQTTQHSMNKVDNRTPQPTIEWLLHNTCFFKVNKQGLGKQTCGRIGCRIE